MALSGKKRLFFLEKFPPQGERKRKNFFFVLKGTYKSTSYAFVFNSRRMFFVQTARGHGREGGAIVAVFQVFSFFFMILSLGCFIFLLLSLFVSRSSSVLLHSLHEQKTGSKKEPLLKLTCPPFFRPIKQEEIKVEFHPVKRIRRQDNPTSFSCHQKVCSIICLGCLHSVDDVDITLIGCAITG